MKCLTSPLSCNYNYGLSILFFGFFAWSATPPETVDYDLIDIDVGNACHSVVLRGLGTHKGSFYVAPNPQLRTTADHMAFKILRNDDGYELSFTIEFPVETKDRVKTGKLDSFGRPMRHRCDDETIRKSIAPLRQAEGRTSDFPVAPLMVSQIRVWIVDFFGEYELGRGLKKTVALAELSRASLKEYYGLSFDVKYQFSNKTQVNRFLDNLRGDHGVTIGLQFDFSASQKTAWATIEANVEEIIQTLQAEIGIQYKIIAVGEFQSALRKVLKRKKFSSVIHGKLKYQSHQDAFDQMVRGLLQPHLFLAPKKAEEAMKKSDGGKTLSLLKINLDQTFEQMRSSMAIRLEERETTGLFYETSLHVRQNHIDPDLNYFELQSGRKTNNDCVVRRFDQTIRANQWYSIIPYRYKRSQVRVSQPKTTYFTKTDLDYDGYNLKDKFPYLRGFTLDQIKESQFVGGKRGWISGWLSWTTWGKQTRHHKYIDPPLDYYWYIDLESQIADIPISVYVNKIGGRPYRLAELAKDKEGYWEGELLQEGRIRWQPKQNFGSLFLCNSETFSESRSYAPLLLFEEGTPRIPGAVPTRTFYPQFEEIKVPRQQSQISVKIFWENPDDEENFDLKEIPVEPQESDLLITELPLEERRIERQP